MGCANRLATMKVLLVEDEKNLAKLLKRALGEMFDFFELAYDAKEGLEKFRQNRHDVVITDITMPKMTGLELADILRRESPQTPVIIISAYSEKEKLLGAIDAGVSKYFIKPFDPDDLIDYLCGLSQKMGKRDRVDLIPPFSFDPKSEQLFKNGVLVHLSPRESRFIGMLYRAPNHFLQNGEIKAGLWEGEEVSDERLRTFIRRLRRKSDKALIENLSARGYVLKVK